MTDTLEHYLDSDAAAGRVMAHARLLLRLARRFEGIVPAGLGNLARVANYKVGKVVIHADNGAVASKLRQMGQRLCDGLSGAGVPCSQVEVKVQPRLLPSTVTMSTLKPLSTDACDALRSTAERLPNGPLQEALENLLRRAAVRSSGHS